MQDLLTRSHAHIWHPCSQMKEYEQQPPFMIKAAKGAHLQLADGRYIIDAISSWWCKSLGHAHSRLQQALTRQIEKFEHIIFANTSYPEVIELSERLTALHSAMSKAFYACEGSSSVEIALKMSLHTRVLQGDSKRCQLISLANGYHGETLAALSVSDLGLYKSAYQALLFQPEIINTIPYVNGSDDPLWHDCEMQWQEVEQQLAPLAETATAIIFEPVLQGAAGMRIYSPDFLRRLDKWAKQHGVHLIADEIMTGFGRTGKMLACDHAGINPDFICLSKGLTAGFLPLSAVLTTDEIYQHFYGEKEKAFLHSHTYSGHALAVAVALEVMTILEEEKLCQRAEDLAKTMQTMMQAIANETGKLSNVRSLGAMVAAEINTKTLGLPFLAKAVQAGAFLRPLGNTMYWLPPLTISDNTLADLAEISLKLVKEWP